MSNFISTDFTFNGIKSIDMGVRVMSVSTESGLIKKPFGIRRKTRTDMGINTNNFNLVNFGNDYEVLTFDLELTKIDGTAFTYTDLLNVGQWLFQDDYCSFVSEDDNTKIFYCKAIGESDFYTNGISDGEVFGVGQGYISVSFECSDSWCFLSPVSYTISTSGQYLNNPMTVSALSQIPCKMEFTALSSNVSITNTTTGQTMNFSGLDVGETISLDQSLGEIVSSSGKYRYNNLDPKVWIKLGKGYNYINFSGTGAIIFEYQVPMLA